MGLTLTFEEIGKVFTRQPALLGLGMVLQYSVLPAIGECTLLLALTTWAPLCHRVQGVTCFLTAFGLGKHLQPTCVAPRPPGMRTSTPQSKVFGLSKRLLLSTAQCLVLHPPSSRSRLWLSCRPFLVRPIFPAAACNALPRHLTKPLYVANRQGSLQM
jgi:hypothetical protein